MTLEITHPVFAILKSWTDYQIYQLFTKGPWAFAMEPQFRSELCRKSIFSTYEQSHGRRYDYDFDGGPYKFNIIKP